MIKQNPHLCFLITRTIADRIGHFRVAPRPLFQSEAKYKTTFVLIKWKPVHQWAKKIRRYQRGTRFNEGFFFQGNVGSFNRADKKSGRNNEVTIRWSSTVYILSCRKYTLT